MIVVQLNCTATLRQFNKKNADFVWNSAYEKAFRNAKLHVANAVTLQFFNPDKDIVIECDMLLVLVLEEHPYRMGTLLLSLAKH